jgi:hypothetical protein
MEYLLPFLFEIFNALHKLVVVILQAGALLCHSGPWMRVLF